MHETLERHHQRHHWVRPQIYTAKVTRRDIKVRRLYPENRLVTWLPSLLRSVRTDAALKPRPTLKKWNGDLPTGFDVSRRVRFCAEAEMYDVYADYQTASGLVSVDAAVTFAESVSGQSSPMRTE